MCRLNRLGCLGLGLQRASSVSCCSLSDLGFHALKNPDTKATLKGRGARGLVHSCAISAGRQTPSSGGVSIPKHEAKPESYPCTLNADILGWRTYGADDKAAAMTTHIASSCAFTK